MVSGSALRSANADSATGPSPRLASGPFPDLPLGSSSPTHGEEERGRKGEGKEERKGRGGEGGEGGGRGTYQSQSSLVVG